MIPRPGWKIAWGSPRPIPTSTYCPRSSPVSTEPYGADRPRLPQSLPAALDALEGDAVFRKELGEVFIDYFLKLKRNEAGRFSQWLEQHGVQESGEPTQWEQNEYFEFF